MCVVSQGHPHPHPGLASGRHDHGGAARPESFSCASLSPTANRDFTLVSYVLVSCADTDDLAGLAPVS